MRTAIVSNRINHVHPHPAIRPPVSWKRIPKAAHGKVNVAVQTDTALFVPAPFERPPSKWRHVSMSDDTDAGSLPGSARSGMGTGKDKDMDRHKSASFGGASGEGEDEGAARVVMSAGMGAMISPVKRESPIFMPGTFQPESSPDPPPSQPTQLPQGMKVMFARRPQGTKQDTSSMRWNQLPQLLHEDSTGSSAGAADGELALHLGRRGQAGARLIKQQRVAGSFMTSFRTVDEISDPTTSSFSVSGTGLKKKVAKVAGSGVKSGGGSVHSSVSISSDKNSWSQLDDASSLAASIETV